MEYACNTVSSQSFGNVFDGPVHSLRDIHFFLEDTSAVAALKKAGPSLSHSSAPPQAPASSGCSSGCSRQGSNNADTSPRPESPAAGT